MARTKFRELDAPRVLKLAYVRSPSGPRSRPSRRCPMSEPAQPRPAAGAVVSDPLAGSKYHVRRVLAEGGSGVVYEAVHVELGKCFAVKVLKPAFASDPMAV